MAGCKTCDGADACTTCPETYYEDFNTNDKKICKRKYHRSCHILYLHVLWSILLCNFQWIKQERWKITEWHMYNVLQDVMIKLQIVCSAVIVVIVLHAANVPLMPTRMMTDNVHVSGGRVIVCVLNWLETFVENCFGYPLFTKSMIFILVCSTIESRCVKCENGAAGPVCLKCNDGYFYSQEYGECRSEYLY